MIIETQTRKVFFSPGAGRAYLTKRSAYRAEASARFFARCDCEDGIEYRDPGYTCDLHDSEGKYKTRRESDGTTLTGRILRRWTELLILADRS